MKIKTFYAKTMAEALREVKSELGNDALLLSTKEIPSRSGARNGASGYEVVAAIEVSDDHALDSQGRDAAEHSAGGAVDCLAADDPSETAAVEDMPIVYTPASIRREAAQAAKGKARPKQIPAKRSAAKTDETAVIADELPFTDAVSQKLYRDLTANGVEESLARRLLQEAQKYLVPKQRRTRSALLQSIIHVAEGMITPPSSEDGIPGKRVVVFVGPTGVGKTTSIAKLGARLALQKRKKVVFMTLDGYRIGAVEQLRTYAGLMGVPFRFVGNVADLPKAIKEHSQRDFILIDTAGRSQRDLEPMGELAAFLKGSTQVERHLVLSATTKASDLQEIVERFEICKPDHLLFTKLDETSSLGPILNELVRSRKALSYYSDGQKVPEDLHSAPKEQILNMVFNRL